MTPTLSAEDAWARRVSAAIARARQGRMKPALAAQLPILANAAASPEALRAVMGSAQAAGEVEIACVAAGRLVELNPTSVVSEHNLAARLGEAGLPAESEAAARRAFAKGGSAPETWLVYARALQAQGRLDEADRAFASALQARPGYLEAHRDRAQLAWMRTGDPESVAASLAPLGDLARANVETAVLVAGVLRQTRDGPTALESLKTWQGPPHPRIHLAAAAAAATFDLDQALVLYNAASVLDPDNRLYSLGRLGALVATGRAQEAVDGLHALAAADGADQYAQALYHLALRELDKGDALGTQDYAREVKVYRLGDRLGNGRAAWLGRLSAALRRLHLFKAEPFDQSLQGGAQSAVDPRFVVDPDIEILFMEIEERVAEHVERLDARAWRIEGAWSVRLHPGGRHVDHVHPRGWLSSAVHIDLPSSLSDLGRQGWLRFGAGRFGLFQQEALHWVRPEPGHLVLFPSHFWHGTEPFTTDGDRLTVAFDVVKI